MASQVEIANMALQMLGESRILRVDDTTESGRTVRSFWSTAIKKMVEDHHWTFGIKRSDELVPEATDPTYGFDYSYQLPSDCLVVLDMNDDRDLVYQVEVNSIGDPVIVTDEDEVYIRYVYDVTQTGRFTANFAMTLAALLAALMALRITGSATDSKNMWQLYGQLSGGAKFRDAMEQEPRTTENTSSQLTARNTRYGYSVPDDA